MIKKIDSVFDYMRYVSTVFPIRVYKYRDWSKSFHKKLINDNELYFSHPHDLNDKFDIRQPWEYTGEINHAKENEYREWLFNDLKNNEPQMSNEELNNWVNHLFNKLKNADYNFLIENRKQWVLDRNNFNHVGVLCLSVTGVNESCWKVYGANHKGFAIGFDTWYLILNAIGYSGYVNYSDSPITIDVNDYLELVFNPNNEDSEWQHKYINMELLKKYTSWKPEEEFRFITSSISREFHRKIRFTNEAVTEIVIGAETSKEDIEEIINACNPKFQNAFVSKVVIIGNKLDTIGFGQIKNLNRSIFRS